MPIGNAYTIIISRKTPFEKNVSFFSNNQGKTVGGIQISPSYITIDPDNKIYTSHISENLMYKCFSNSNLINTESIYEYMDQNYGTGSTAKLPYTCKGGITIDYNNAIYIGGDSNKLYKFEYENRVHAGNNNTSGSVTSPGAMVSSIDNIIYITSSKYSIVKTKANIGTGLGNKSMPISAFVGSTTKGYSDGNGSVARFGEIGGLAIDLDDNIYASDMDNHTIRKISPNGNVTTIAGTVGVSGNNDGVNLTAKFSKPIGICCDHNGNIYVCDNGNRIIRKITPIINGGTIDYNVTTLAGNGNNGDTEGDYLLASFKSPYGIAIMNDGNLLVTDTEAFRIKKILNPISTKTNFDITLNSDRYNLVLEKELIRRGWDGKTAITCNFNIPQNVYVYSISNYIPAFSIGSSLSSSTITISNSGYIIGAGGNGGESYVLANGSDEQGGDAFKIRSNIILKNYGIIGGGGGAGNASNSNTYGGGGAGKLAGSRYVNFATAGYVYGNDGTLLSGGKGAKVDTYNRSTGKLDSINKAGNGGNLGQPGEAGVYTTYNRDGTISRTITVNTAFPAGNAIDGMSYVTIDPSSTGTLSGATI